MHQAINLYTHLDQKLEPRFSARQGAIAASVLAVFMLLMAAGLKVNTSMQTTALNDAQQQRDELQQTLASLQSDSATLASGDMIAVLRSEIDAKRSLLASVGDGSNAGFSEYMAGLGRQHVNGLWLEKVAVGKHGAEIAISGAMQKPSMLPRYLQQLGNETVFRGMRFQLVKIEELPKQKQQMRFEVAAAGANDSAKGADS